MSTYPIRLYGDAVLRRRSQPVTRFDAEFRRLGETLAETMLAAEGAGLAAPQVGVPLRVFALAGAYAGVLDPAEEHDPETERAAVRLVVNPQLVDHAGSRVDVEGCLSIPGVYADVERAAMLTLRYQDLDGVWHEEPAEGLHAKAVQHEIDHLDGVLFLDRLARDVRAEVMETHRADLAQMQRDARAHLKELRAAGLPPRPWPERPAQPPRAAGSGRRPKS
ncbi:MAG: peptide deformylase [Trueperaceae bacterium]|nr:peptide deformylase [Trueperaceae bacterium]